VYGPQRLPKLVAEWLRDSFDTSQCQDPGLVRRGIDTALTWLAAPGVLPEPRLRSWGSPTANRPTSSGTGRPAGWSTSRTVA
jgi:hypothetical protein